MQNSKVSLRILLYMVAAAAISALVFLHAPVTFAQTTSGSDTAVSDADSGTDPILSGSDALAAALADSSLAVIELDEYAVYTIERTLTVNRNVTIFGNGATLDFSKDAYLSVPEGIQLTLSSVSLNSTQGYSMTVSGSVIFGEGVSFGGDTGIMLKKNGMLTSSGKAVTALSGLKALVHADPSGASLLLKDIRLAQTSGETNLLTAANSGGYIVISGTVDILAADGMAVYCPSSADGPVFSVEGEAQLSVAAQNAVLNQELDIPGAAMDIRSCDFTTGSGSILGITGSYCGIAAKNITLGTGTAVTALCAKKSENESSFCAALSAAEKLTCQNKVAITVGSSGGNYGSGLSASDGIELSSGISVVFRINSSYGCALYSEGAINAGAECSVLSQGGRGGIYGKGISFGEQLTLDVEDVSGCGLYSSGATRIGAKATIDIKSSRSAIYSTGGISFSPESLVALESEGNDAAVWLDGTSADSLALDGCTISVTCTTNSKAKKNAAIFVSGAVTADNGADITIINGSDFGLVCAGGSVTVKGEKTVLRVSGGAGMLLSQGSLLISDGAEVLAEGTADSAVRIEKGSFSATGKASVDAQGKRFGIETLSGDVYIDGAAFFDIRSTTDRAVFVENGRLTIINVERLSAWNRDPDNVNWHEWWMESTDYTHSWELTEKEPDENWRYAAHTALAPNLTCVHRQGVADKTDFSWHDGEWSPADYSRLGQYISRPSGRANAFNIPAGKSFSWMLFGSSYDNTLNFQLLKSTGDGTFDLREDGTFTYSSLDYSRGVQSFEFVVENGDGALSDPATINIFVTASKPPVASSATYPVNADEKYIGQVSIMDYDGTIASINIDEQPTHGTLIMNSDGRFSYEPDYGYIGSDLFTYTAVDNMGDESSRGYITLAVGMKDNIIPCNSTIITESSVQASTRLTAILGNDNVQPAPQFQIVTPPVYGELMFDENEPDLVTYIPYEDFSGTDLFTYSAVLEDGTITQPACVTIATVPSQRPIATGGTFYCTKNSSCSGKLTGYDIDGAIALYSVDEQPEHGIISLNTVTGEFTYQAQSGFTGETWFTFRVIDRDGLISEPVRVTIRVSSLIDNLRSTGRLGAAAIILCVVLVAAGGVIALIITSSARRRRELDDEKAKSRLFDYSGSDSDDYDFLDDYRS